MSFKNKSFLQSFQNAYRGIKNVIISERNIKTQLFMLFLAILTGTILKFNNTEWIAVILMGVLVLGLEMINTAIETTIDMICQEKFNILAKRAKDIAAGAVLLASVGAVIVGAMIVIPKIINLIK